MDNRQVIVYVDDDYDDLVYLQEAFREIEEYQLVCLQNGKELFSLLETDRANVCLIVLDINMPLMSGIDILLELRSRKELMRIPAVMLSTARSPKENQIVQGLGSEILTKPSSYSESRTLAFRLLQYC